MPKPLVMNVNGFDEPRPFEIVGGIKFPKMAARPSHQNFVANTLGIFRSFLRGGSCRVFMETYVFLEEKEMYIPDLVVVCNPAKIDLQKGIMGAPDLVCEALSRSTSKRDRITKKAIYEKHGVKEYWILDDQNQSLEVYHLINGKYELNDIYFAAYDELELQFMTKEQKDEITYTFKTSLFDDLTVDVRDVFED